MTRETKLKVDFSDLKKIIKEMVEKPMKEQPKQETHYGKDVWVNQTTESLRRSECLCLNCGNLKPGQSDNCNIAQEFYQICVKENVALTMTRCPLWKPKS